MKTHFRFLCLCLVMLCAGAASRAQLTGTITIPNTTYPTLASVITALNTQGVGNLGVTINFTAATNETAPVGGYRLGSAVLNASTSASNPVTINGNGNVITAAVGTSTSADGIFYIQGTDYVTINNLNLVDATANTTTTTQAEWGYVLCKLNTAAPFNGCQNDVINGCTITLKATNSATIGIYVAHIAAASATVLSTTGVVAADANSFNSFTANTINGVTRGIYLNGMATTSNVALFDQNNKVGGTTAASGNTITVGGSSNTAYSVYTNYDTIMSVQNNTFAVASGQSTTFYHLYTGIGRGDLNIKDNYFNINCTLPTSTVYVWYNYYYNTGHADQGTGLAATSTHTITGNTVTGNNTTATSSALYGFYDYYAYSKAKNYSNNKFININWGASTGYIYGGIYSYYTYATDYKIDSNLMYNVVKTGTAGYIYAFYGYNPPAVTGTYSAKKNTVRAIKNNYYIYANYYYAGSAAPPTGYTYQRLTSKYNVCDSIDMSGTVATCYLYNYMGYCGGDTSEVSYDTVSNVKMSATTTNYCYNMFGYGNYGPNQYWVRGNCIKNITGLNFYGYAYMGYYATRVDSNTITDITMTGTTATTWYNYLGYYSNGGSIAHNRVNNFNFINSTIYYYTGYYGGGYNYHHNAFTNLRINGSGSYYSYGPAYYSSSANIYNNRYDSIMTTTTGTFQPFYCYANGGTDNVYNNIISNLKDSANNTLVFNAMWLGGTGGAINAYNNLITNIEVPAAYATSGSTGMNLASSIDYKVYNNTIRIAPSSTGGASNFGYTGLLFTAGGTVDLRNNIINVNVTPASGGYVAALRRSSSAGVGVSPANFLPVSNANILYAPNVTSSWLYGEGTSAAGMTNTYNLTNDVNFNTPCGLWKQFLGHNKSSFTENNLIPGALPATYVPTGSSYAESGSVVVTAPAITTDYTGTTRSAVADIGALEFSGTSIDNAPPVISYTPVPVKSYCVTTPTIIATITDNTGVNTTTSKPRLYYKKSSETNAFGGGNTSSTSGWKYVEPTTISGNTYTFDFDYTLLTSAVVAGDSITYFIIAQDVTTAQNTGANIAGFPLCPTSVNLGSTYGPINATPVPNGYKILSTPTFTINGFPAAVCISGSSVLSIVPVPVGATVQWQQATLTGTFSNISGATNPTYNTGNQTVTQRYQAIIYCGSSTLTTTAIDTFVVANPLLISTTGATRCGYGPLTLGTTTGPFTTPKWYTTATGGSSFYSGTSYTTPPLSSSVTYYVSGNTPNASTEILTKVPVSYGSTYSYGASGPSNGYGERFVFKSASTNFYSTTVYPTGAGTFHLYLWDSASNTVAWSSLLSSAPNGGAPYAVTAGSGINNPTVLQMNAMNLPRGTYYLMMDWVSGQPYLNYEYNAALPYPFVSPSGNSSMVSDIEYGTHYTNYYWFFYYNVLSGDCESATRLPVTATITPAPAITASSPNVPGICLGSSATLNVSSANASYTYNWVPGSLTGTSVTVTPTTSTTYFVTATDPYTGCVNRDSIIMNVNVRPAPPTISPRPATICEKSSVLLTGAPAPGLAGTASIGTGTSATTVPSPTYGTYTSNHVQYLFTAAELAAAGVQVGSLTSIAFNTTAGTSYATDNFTIKLANLPTTVTSLSTFLCTPAQTTVYYVPLYTPPAAGGWTTYTFNTGTFTYTGGNLLVDASHMNCTTCPATPCNLWGGSVSTYYTTTSNNSTVYSYADANCTVNTCTSTASIYTSTARANIRIGYRQPADLNWLNVTGLYKNSGLSTPVTLTDTNKSVYASPPTTQVYTAVTNLQGCISLPSLPDTVYVNPAPIVTVTPAGPQAICSGQTITYCIPTGGNQIYQWYLNGVAITGATTNCYTASAPGSYGVKATNIITGCFDTSIRSVLVVNPLPVITATAVRPTTFCNGDSVRIVANSTTALAWQWMNNGVNIPGATSASYLALTSGSYTVSVTNSFGCTAVSNAVPVNVNITPNTVVPQGSTTFCTGGSVVLQGPTTGSGAPFTYQWYNAGGAIAGATGSSYTASVTNNYWVIVTSTVTGCSSTSTSFQVTVGAPPSSAITPAGAVGLCSGNSVTLTTNTSTGLVYQWYLNTIPIPGATNATLPVTAGGSYTVRVSISGTLSCNSTTATPTVVTVNPRPIATATPGGPTTFCIGNNVVISANTGTGLSYQWNQGGNTILGATNATYTAIATGSYTVRVTNNTTGCDSVSNAVSVTVNPLPVATVSSATSTTFCQGGSVVLTAPAGMSTYQWNLNGVAVATGGTSATYSATATGLYSVTIVNSNGCQNTSSNVAVQVNPLPNVVTVPTGNAAVCQGSTTTFNVTPGAAQSYQWMIGGVNIGGATSAAYTTGTAGTYTVKVTNTITSCQATSAPIILTVNTPPAALAVADGATTICQDDSAGISANTGTGLTYQWRLNGSALPGATNRTYYAKLAGSYTVAVSNAANCTTISNPVVIIVNPRPAAYITYNSALEFCEGSAVVLTANSGQSLTYQWLMNGSAIGNTGTYNISAVTGAYALKVTNNFGCSTTSDTVSVLVHPTPLPVVTNVNNTSLQTTVAFSSYQWFYQNNAIGGATNSTYTFTQNGAYKVRVVDIYGCEGTSDQYFINNLGIKPGAAGSSIHIYPNPTSGILHIDAKVKVKVALRDVTGRTVIEATDAKEIDLGDVASGTYLLYISDMEGQLLRAEKVTKTNN